MGEKFIVNSPTSLLAFTNHAQRMYEEKKFVTFEWRFGEQRSLDQNALFHVWCTEYAAHLLNKDKKSVTDGELTGMKRIVKKRFYAQTGQPWMVETVINPFDPSQTRKDYTSSRKWRRGEMFDVLTWMQMMAANDGLVLESKGEFKHLQSEAA